MKTQTTLHPLQREREKSLRRRLGFRIGGLISHQFFRDYALTFDFMGMRLILADKGV